MLGTSRVRLVRASVDDKPILRALLSEYLAELAAVTGTSVTRDEQGHVPYRYFDAYWRDPARIPFGIWLDGEIAGFCLLRDAGDRWQIAEFYVMPAARRAGVGAAAITELKQYCLEEPVHRTIEARTLPENFPAIAFWRAQGFERRGMREGMLVNEYELWPGSG